MKPVLFDKTATTFTNLGKGMLTEVTSAVTIQEINGIFDLELEIAKSDPLFAEIECGSIITAIPSPYSNPEPFRVYKIEKELNGISSVYCHHISYDLAGIIVNPYTASSAGAAMSGLSSHAAQPCPFTFATTKTTTASFKLEIPQAIRTTLGGIEGSILDVFRGEYLFQGYTVTLMTQMGTDRGFEVRYRKNIVGLSVQEDTSGCADGAVGYWTSEDHAPVYGTIQWKTGLSAGRVVTVDYSDKYQDAPTSAQLDALASALVNTAGYGEPDISIEVDFLHLGTERAGYRDLEKCYIGDTVRVVAEPLGTTRSARVVATETDVLREVYNKVTIGSVRADIAQTIVANQKEAANATQTTKSFLEESLALATERITGATDGYVRFKYNANGELSEILAMDTNDESTAVKVLRLNYEGWALSTTGVNGPFAYALTADDGLNASVINVGTLQGIRAILESGSIGGWDIETSWIKKDYTDANNRSIRAALVSPVNDDTMVLYAMYTIGGVMYPKFYIKAGGNSYFTSLDGLTVGTSGTHKDSNLYGNLSVAEDFYLTGNAHITGNTVCNDQAFINNTLWLEWGGTVTGRIAASAGDYMYFGGTDSDRWVNLAKISGHWGFSPWSDTYLDLGHSGHRWDNVYAQNGTIQTSDRKAKKYIKALGEKMVDFVLNLKPVKFKMKNGKRDHFGFIAQDVEEEMQKRNFDSGILIKDETEDGTFYGLRYEELIAPIVKTLQSLDKRISKLEGKEDVTS